MSRCKFSHDAVPLALIFGTRRVECSWFLLIKLRSRRCRDVCRACIPLVLPVGAASCAGLTRCVVVFVHPALLLPARGGRTTVVAPPVRQCAASEQRGSAHVVRRTPRAETTMPMPQRARKTREYRGTWVTAMHNLFKACCTAISAKQITLLFQVRKL